jgi:hypothetical protein
MNVVDIRKMTSLSDDAREALTAVFDVMEKWRDEISATNDRCLPKLVDQLTEVQRAIGWPPHWSATERPPQSVQDADADDRSDHGYLGTDAKIPRCLARVGYASDTGLVRAGIR